MSIACELPVCAGRAGRWLSASARAVPALGSLSCAVLLSQGAPAWAETWLSDLSLRAAQACFATAALAWAVWALQALFARSKPLERVRGVHAGHQRIVLEQSGLARIGEESLRLDSVCSLPGLIVAIFAPISPACPKLRAGQKNPVAMLLRRRHRVLLIGQDALSQEQWRRLHVWLLWVQRAPR